MSKSFILLISGLLFIAGLSGVLLFGAFDPLPQFSVCDENGNRYTTEQEARATGLADHQFGATYCAYFEFKGSETQGTVTRDYGADLARAYVEGTELYAQDGHNLRLTDPTPDSCASCFDFVFDHYGDPDGDYRISVKVHADGRIEEIK